jgi:putative transposase
VDRPKGEAAATKATAKTKLKTKAARLKREAASTKEKTIPETLIFAARELPCGIRVARWSRMTFARKNIRRCAQNYLGQRSYFITICAADRRRILVNPVTALSLIQALRKHGITYKFAIRAYRVMPDHFHILATGLEPTSDLLALVKHFKLTTSREYLKTSDRFLWQKKFYDYILRSGDDRAEVAAYIWMNPVRAGLCADPRDYPYSGSFAGDWKEGNSGVVLWVPVWKGKTRPTAGSKSKARA